MLHFRGVAAIPRAGSAVRPRFVFIAVAAACVAGALAAAVANLDLKAQAIAFGLVTTAVGLLTVRRRAAFVLLLLVVDVQIPFYKALGPLDLSNDAGAPGLYITTVDVLLLVLYGLWWAKGTLVSDLRELFADRGVIIPLLVLGAALPSFLVAENLWLASSELVRVALGGALYVYVAARVRSRRDVGVIIAGLFAIAVFQFLLIVLQWRTGVSAMLPTLGLESSTLADRVTIQGDVIQRPNGTLFHSTVAGAVLGPIALVALSLSLAAELPRRWRAPTVGALVAAVVAILLAQPRASMAGLAFGGVILLLVQFRRGYVTRRLILGTAVALLLVAVVARNQVFNFLGTNLATDHLWQEVAVRLELNDVAMHIIRDAPVFGIGLNNHETVMDRYTPHGVEFPGFPAHNLYLLTWSETGALGLLALLIAFWVLFRYATRLARVRDPMFAALGTALAATYVFFLIEETMAYSLRHTHATLLFWLLAGLTVAASRIAASVSPGDAPPTLMSDPPAPPWPAIPRGAPHPPRR